MIDGPAIGDLYDMSAALAVLKLHQPNAQIVVIQKGRTRPYSEYLLLNPHIDYLITVDGTVTLDDLVNPIYKIGSVPDEVRELLFTPHLVYSPFMLHNACCMGSGSLLTVPDWVVDESNIQLANLGVDMTKEFVCIHVRQDGYRGPNRNSVYDLEPYIRLTEFIIENLDLQVLRLGDPTMDPFPARKGYFDLCHADGAFLLHNYAVSRARYMIGTTSGPCCYALQFDTPLAYTNMATTIARPNSINICLTKTFVLPNGERVSGRQALTDGIMDERWNSEYGLMIENSYEDLVRVADYMYENTVDRPPWTPSPPTVFPNASLGDLLRTDISNRWDELNFLEEI